ncbi:ATP-binding protein [Epilithonimonas pallida]|uniref:sensor histidine kinase n=1 Tax=Epilithonimonas pallida TaxID=373671 RepID=UPI003211F63E
MFNFLINELKIPLIKNISLTKQYTVSILTVLMVAFLCFSLQNWLSYRTSSLILLMTVSVIAMLFDIVPVIISAVLSALIWNFFFIPPVYNFHINNTQDLLMFFLYFFIALVNAVLTFKIREAEKKARDKEEKENTIKLYNTLLNSLSHELRTPIATILGAVDTLNENKEKLSIDNQNILLNEIGKAGFRLNRQVENLLNISRLENGILRPKFDWCDMNDLINSVLQKLSVNENHKIIFQSDETLPLFRIDEGFTEQIIHNLLHNSIQYTSENSIIEIEVRHQSENLIILISDNGNGFPEDKMDLVFNKFYRLPNTKAGGSGLGLSIVKGFVEAQNGKIKLNNKENGGAVFTVEIPAEMSYINHLKNE